MHARPGRLYSTATLKIYDRADAEGNDIQQVL
jgi:hypothetical protein